VVQHPCRAAADPPAARGDRRGCCDVFSWPLGKI